MYTRPFRVSAVTVPLFSVILPALNSTRLRGSRLPSLAPPNRAITSFRKRICEFEYTLYTDVLKFLCVVILGTRGGWGPDTVGGVVTHPTVLTCTVLLYRVFSAVSSL